MFLGENFAIWNNPVIGWDTLKGCGYTNKPIDVYFAVTI